MDVAVTGASGAIGSALVSLLAEYGHTVRRLVRREPAAADEVRWDPQRRELDPAGLAGAEAVVHLAGETFEGKWDAEKRRLIRESRVGGAALLAERIAAVGDGRPRSLLTASAIGYYGSRADTELTEDSPPASGFIAQMCADTETAASAATAAGVRVVALRTGIVQWPDGGMLGTLLPQFRRGLGARLGLGRRHLSWVAMDDVARAYLYALTEDISGPVNVVAPHPVTNAEFTRALAAAVHRPALLAIPPLLPRLALGGFAEEVLLQDARVVPRRLLASGFTFHYPKLAEALVHLVGNHKSA